MNRILAIAALLIACNAQAQQPSIIDQVDQAIAMERATANTALAIKDQRIAAFQQQIEQLKKEATGEVLKKVTPDKDAKVLTVPVPLKEVEAVCFATNPVQCFAPREEKK